MFARLLKGFRFRVFIDINSALVKPYVHQNHCYYQTCATLATLALRNGKHLIINNRVCGPPIASPIAAQMASTVIINKCDLCTTKTGACNETDNPKQQTVENKTYIGLGVVLIGASLIAYYVYEIFFNKNPEDLVTKSLNRCRWDKRVQEVLGIPIKYFGIGYSNASDDSGSRKPYLEFEADGKKFIRLKLYHRGTKKRGSLILEFEKNTENCRYLYFEVVGDESNIIVLEDNRNIAQV